MWSFSADYPLSNSKHSWSGILVQYLEQIKDDGTTIKIPPQLLIKVEHSKVFKRTWARWLKRPKPFTFPFKNGVLPEGSSCNGQNWSCLHALEIRVLNDKNDKVNNWSQDMHAITPHIKLKHIKGEDNVLADSLSRLRHLGLHDDNDPEDQSGQVKNTANQFWHIWEHHK